MQEAITAEFSSSSATNTDKLKVKFNNKVYTWEQFLKLAKIDSEAQTVLAVVERDRQKSGFDGDMGQFILKKYRYNSPPVDVSVKKRTDGKLMVDVDEDEVERVQSDTSQPDSKYKAGFDLYK